MVSSGASGQEGRSEGHHDANGEDGHPIAPESDSRNVTPDWPFDDEFGLCMDPCEHPSINGTTCAACGEEVPRGT